MLLQINNDSVFFRETIRLGKWGVSAAEYDYLGRARISYNPFYVSTPTGAVPVGKKFTEVSGIDALERGYCAKL